MLGWLITHSRTLGASPSMGGAQSKPKQKESEITASKNQLEPKTDQKQPGLDHKDIAPSDQKQPVLDHKEVASLDQKQPESDHKDVAPSDQKFESDHKHKDSSDKHQPLPETIAQSASGTELACEVYIPKFRAGFVPQVIIGNTPTENVHTAIEASPTLIKEIAQQVQSFIKNYNEV
ncbi:unnamed protein product [Thelazia callipaeda]|uniref:Spore germination protein n=1 Tax=Thelazia callipaeda TaxID=103827 RepID=A0A0N5CXT7_THECL|nr:unnamed protein product [Thelazia callipaeda]